MFWGYIKFTGEKNLVIVTGSRNSEKYMDILKENLLEDVQEGDLFQHNNAPAHKSQKTARFLNSNGVQLLEKFNTPQSPDLNIIKNLWSYLTVKVMLPNFANMHSRNIPIFRLIMFKICTVQFRTD